MREREKEKNNLRYHRMRERERLRDREREKNLLFVFSLRKRQKHHLINQPQDTRMASFEPPVPVPATPTRHNLPYHPPGSLRLLRHPNTLFLEIRAGCVEGGDEREGGGWRSWLHTAIYASVISHCCKKNIYLPRMAGIIIYDLVECRPTFSLSLNGWRAR